VHVAPDACVARDGAHPRLAHRDAPPAKGDLAFLGAVPCRVVVRSGSCFPFCPATSAASTSSPITSRPIATEAANRPWRIGVANASSWSLTFPASRPDRDGSSRSTSPISGSNRRLPAVVFVVCNAWFFIGGPPFSTRFGVRTPSVPHGTIEAEDRH
jgi:hypothetical protein